MLEFYGEELIRLYNFRIDSLTFRDLEKQVLEIDGVAR